MWDVNLLSASTNECKKDLAVSMKQAQLAAIQLGASMQARVCRPHQLHATPLAMRTWLKLLAMPRLNMGLGFRGFFASERMFFFHVSCFQKCQIYVLMFVDLP
jgi:hypothetical protein